MTEKPTDPADVTSREGAERWLGRRIKQIYLLAILSVALTPVAVVVVLVIRLVVKGYAVPPMSVFIPGVLMWSGIGIALLLFVALLIGRKRFMVARRVRPILARGTERAGRVVDVQNSERRAGGVNHYKVMLAVETEDGARISAALEEMEGTDLPEVEPDAPATVWTLGHQNVVGTCGSLFESEA